MTAEGSVAALATLGGLLALLILVPPESHGIAQAGCAALLALAAVVAGRRLPAGPTRWLAVFPLLAIPAARAAQAPGAAVEPLALLALALGAGTIAASLAARHRGLRRTLGWWIAGLAACAAVHGLVQRFWTLDRLLERVAADPTLPDRGALVARLDGGRAFAGFLTPAGLGGMLALALPLTVALALDARGRRRSAAWLLVALQIGGFLAAASSTAGGALLLATTALAWQRARAGRRLAVAGAVVGVALAVLGAVAVQRGGIALRPDDPTGPWRLRAGNFRAALEMAADHPWVGVGPGGFAERYPTYRVAGDNETRHVHDLPLELLAEWGVPAGAAAATGFFWLFAWPIFGARRRPLFERGMAVGLAAFAFHNLGDFTAFMPSLLILAAVVRGLYHAPARAPEPVSLRLALPSWGALLAGAVVLAAAGQADDHRLAARYAAHAGETDEAARLSRQALRLAPWNPDVVLLAARAHEGREEGPALADRAVALSPVRPAARVHRARVRLGRGDVAGAHADLSRAVELYPWMRSYAAERDGVARRLREGWM